MSKFKTALNLATSVVGTLLLLYITGASGIQDKPADYRITSFNELQEYPQVALFHHPYITDFVQISLDIRRQQVLVGAKNYLLRLSLQNLAELEVADWRPSNETRTICKAKGQTDAECHNFIKVLHVHTNNKVFTCGTHAFAPKCSWREVTNIRRLSGPLISGVGKCPYSPNYNSTTLLTRSGDLYTTTVMDFTARDPAIFRIMGPSTALRTVQYDSKWLNAPNFISSYEVGEFVYFFFRETALEYINCGKAVYPRVARVCKTDSGGSFLLKDNWTTFVKARLNCSLPGSFPFYYTELQSTYYAEEEQKIYAVFTTPENSLHGSAVCAFNMTAFDQAFSGPFKYQEHPQDAWHRVDNPQPGFKCAPAQSKRSQAFSNSAQSQRKIFDAQKYQLMDDAVQPIQITPLVSFEKERWTHLVVDKVRAKHRKTFHVMFLATLDGVLKKVVQLPGTNKSCTIEEIHLYPAGQEKPIHSIKLHKEEGLIYVGTKDSVIKVPVERCDRFKSKLMCMNARDPYCGWNSRHERCTTIPRNNGNSHNHWHQNINSCPILEYPVDGGWSDWSDWTMCNHIGDQRSGDRCLCRARACNNPRPFYGGLECDGDGVEVRNCTVNGQWTEWSAWSSCSQSCGVAIRERKRTCGNPKPQFGGRICVGSDIDEEHCLDLPECPVPTPAPVHGGWSDWTDWTPCSHPCGRGMQQRRRHCSEPEPGEGGNDCSGNDRMWKLCNTHACPEIKRSSQWTDWLKTNYTKDGSHELRFKFVCRTNVTDLDAIRIAIKTEGRFCSTSGKDCGDSGLELVQHVDGQWSGWTQWTQCDRQCEGGRQWRERKCTSPPPSGTGKNCDGHGKESRQCNSHSCKGEWSCWSEFSSCSVSCGHGVKWRRRECLSTAPGGGGKGYNVPCSGKARDEVACDMDICNGMRPTAQNSSNKPHRNSSNPLLDRAHNEVNVAAVSGNEERKNFELVHLIVVGLIGFIIGGVVAIGIFIYCQRMRKQKFNITKATQNGRDSKPQLYMVPSHSQISLTMNNTKPNFYSTGSLPKNDNKLTVKEATLKRNSLMRTNLSLNDL